MKIIIFSSFFISDSFFVFLTEFVKFPFGINLMLLPLHEEPVSSYSCSHDKVCVSLACQQLLSNYNVSVCCVACLGLPGTKYHQTQLFDKKTGNCISLNSNDISDIITVSTEHFRVLEQNIKTE